MAQDPSTPNQYFWWPTIGDVTWLNFFEWWVAGINKRRFLKKDVRYGTEMDDAVFCTSVCTFVYKKGRKHRDVLIVLCQFWKRSMGTTTFVQNFHKASSEYCSTS